ncbi:hypothetical protein BDQ17DRAFT_1364597 [Cyathus striatus]|nr:hypothetical protein BDQ17DRAFT_1364597 [Cyathus striatus]
MTAEIQRPLRGSRISSFYPVKSLPSLSSLDRLILSYCFRTYYIDFVYYTSKYKE